MSAARHRARAHHPTDVTGPETGLPRRRTERRAAGKRRPVRILLVEDDDDIRLLLTLALRAEDFDVTPVVNADQALRAMRDRRHDLILTDYCLPGKDGIQMIAEAQSSGVLSQAPVILCTAFPPAGPSSVTVLEKPIELDALVAQIRKALRR
jgi:DNA-binding response OmpR family regulator